MALIPLLPKTKGQNWPNQSPEGLYGVSDVDYQRNLCESYFEASDFGTPSPMAYPMVVADRLERYLKESGDGTAKPRFGTLFEQWSLMIQGLYFDLIEVRPLALERMGGLGSLLAQELRDEADLALLVFDSEVIGMTEHRALAVPGVRVAPEAFQGLAAAVAEKTTQGAKEIFARWARREVGRFPCLATSLLTLLGRKWAGAEQEPLEEGQESLFDPGISIPVGDQPGEALKPLQLVVYRGTPISCTNCGYAISREAPASAAPFAIRTPKDCVCLECGVYQGWLEDYGNWIKFDEELNRYLIYAFNWRERLRTDSLVELDLKEDGVIIKTGRFAMKVFGMVLSEERLKCDRLTCFLDGGKKHWPFLPVKGQYFDLVTPSARGAIVVDADRYQVFVKVRGWTEEIRLRFEAEEIHREEALVLVWPDFLLKSWSTYFYLVDAERPKEGSGLSVSLLRRKREPEVRRESRGRVSEPFEALEMIFLRDGSEEMEHAGIFMPGWRNLERGESPVTLSLDFGTSATVLWYKVGEDDPRPLKFKDRTHTVIAHGARAEEVLAQSRWLPTYSAGAATESQAEESPFLPSEMVISNDRASREDWMPIRDYRLLHPLASQPEGKLLFEIKSEGANGTKDGAFRFSDLVTNYLETVFLLALGSVLDALPHTGYFKLRYAFPRAFSTEKLDVFGQALATTIERVHQGTGLRCSERKFLDEAQAAAYAVEVRGEACLVMDMGGGTTDVCLFQWKDGVMDPVLQDSLQYGGGDFLRLLVSHESLFPNPALEGEDPLLWLIREVRRDGFGAVVRNYYRAEAQAKSQAASLLLRFLEPIVYFVRRLFDSLEERGHSDLAKRPLTVYLMGNGWSLADGISAVDDSLGRAYEEVLRGLLRDRGFNVSILTQPEGVQDWTGPKAAVAYGALMASEKALLSSAKKASDQSAVTSIVGFDLKIDDGSGETKEVPWHAPVPLPLEGAECRPILSGISLPDEWRDYVDFSRRAAVHRLERICGRDVETVGINRLNRSVLTRFIETVYLESLKEVGAGKL